MQPTTAFDYGEYERLARDPRTRRVPKAVKTVARKLSVKYALVGGLTSALLALQNQQLARAGVVPWFSKAQTAMPFTRNLPKLTALLFLFAACCLGQDAKPPIPPPSAEIVAYAKAHGLEPEMSLDLGKGVKIEFVLIPAGKFLMGSPETEKGRLDNETQHEVTISKPFYMGRYEVTQEQYEAITGTNPSHFKGAKNAVDTVSWDDAQDFCKMLSAKASKTVQLPTEAQWEYACRAGTNTRFCSGDADGDLDGVGWYYDNSGNTTHPVGEKKPNAWGLYDMHGNVVEWCQDWYGQYEAEAATDPKGAADGPFRVLRGGPWSFNPAGCRSAVRDRSTPGVRFDLDGFRVVLAGPP